LDVKRRTAIKQLGWGLSAGLALPSILSACDDKEVGPEVQYDGVVGIIGAGAAGLFAADILRSKGIKVRVFEANNRVGGRIYSVRPSDPDFETFPKQDFPVELGADRILGTDGSWAKAIKLLNVPTIEYQGISTPQFVIDGVLKTEAQAMADLDFVQARNFLNNVSSITGGSVLNAMQSAGISSRMHAILNSLIGNQYGTTNANLGASELARALTVRERNDTELILRDNPLIDVLISRFFNTVAITEVNRQVTQVNYGGDLVELTVRNRIDQSQEVITVNKLIVTVPLSLLKSGDIQFTPGLPGSKTSAMSRLGMDASFRAIIDFRQNLWGDESSFILGGTDSPLYFNAGIGRSDFNKILSVTVNGPKAAELSAMGSSAVNELVLELDPLLDGKASENIKSIFVIKDWSIDPFTKGGYSYPLASSVETDRADMAAPVNDTLFFAGEATDITGDWGTVNGALNSAERAALEVINSILNPA
jgi:monoamine oxidase